MSVSRLVMLSLLMSACADEEPHPDWCRAGPGEAVIWLPEEGPGELLLEEIWRVGGVNGSEVIGDPSRPSLSRSGRVALADMQASSVIVIDADGIWRGPIVKRGQGPGEVQWPVDVEWVGDRRLAVFDLANGVTQVFDVDEGEVVDRWEMDRQLYAEITSAGSLPGLDLDAAGGMLIELPWRATDAAASFEATVVYADRTGAIDTVQIQEVRGLTEAAFARLPVPGRAYPRYAVASNGPIVTGGASRTYRVEVLGQDLAVLTVICRAIEASPYTASEKGEVIEPAGFGAALEAADRPDDPAVVGGLFLGEMGRIWILRDRPQPETFFGRVEGGLYDVVSARGELQGTVRAPERTTLFGESDGVVIGLQRGRFDEVSVVAYQLAERSDSGS